MNRLISIAILALLTAGAARADIEATHPVATSDSAPRLGTLANTIDSTVPEGKVVIDQLGSGHCSSESLTLLEVEGSLSEDDAVQMLYYYPSKAQDILDAARTDHKQQVDEPASAESAPPVADVPEQTETAVATHQAAGFLILVIVGITLVVFIYFAPTYVAFKRKHKDKLAILVFNIFFGWFAWIWALTGNVEGR